MRPASAQWQIQLCILAPVQVLPREMLASSFLPASSNPRMSPLCKRRCSCAVPRPKLLSQAAEASQRDAKQSELQAMDLK